MKNVLLLGAVAILVILGMRSCDQNKTADAGKEVAVDAKKEAVADKAEAKSTEAAPSTSVAKKAVSRKAPAKKKRVRTAKPAAVEAAPAVSSVPSTEHHKSNRYVFGADNTK